MGQIDWKTILSIESASVRQDHDLADKLILDFTNHKITPEETELTDLTNVVKLFDVIRELLMFKEDQVYVAEDEVARLVQENEMVKEENVQFKKHSGTGERSMLAELSRLEDRNHVLERELDSMSNKYSGQCHQTDVVGRQLQEAQTKIASLEREVERGRNDVRDLHRQLEAQRDRLTIRKDRESLDHSRKLNEEVSSYMAEIDVLERDNKELQERLNGIEKELHDATNDMNVMANDYNNLRKVVEDTDKALDEVRRERDLLKGQNDDFLAQVQLKQDSDDRLTLALNQKIEEWKVLMAGKDKEILDRDALIMELQRKLQTTTMDTEKETVADLVSVLKEKDEKIKELKSKLDIATTEMKNVTEKIEEVKLKSKDGIPSLKQQAKIDELSKTLRKEQMTTLKERSRVDKVEEDAAEKDRLISELMTKIMQYEKGQYGLPEAVQEIKEYRNQVRLRDKNIEDLTMKINKLQIQADDLEAENEELRDRLGLDPKTPLDSEMLRKKQRVNLEQANALNRQLAKEVERLEEERLQLKQQLRKQAMHRGERAVEVGLTAEDLAVVEEVATAVDIRDLHSAVDKSLFHEHMKWRKNEDLLKDQVALYKREVEANQVKLENVVKDTDRLNEENRHLRDGLNELLEVMKNKEFPAGEPIRIPSLEKLVELFEATNAMGEVDVSIGFKNEIMRLRGQNEELKSELRIARDDIKGTVIECNEKTKKLERQEDELKILREAGLGIVKINPLPLPEGIKPSSSDIISSLNEFIIQILQDMSNKEELVFTMEQELEKSRRNIVVLSHQLSLVYREHQDEKSGLEKEITSLKEERNKLQIQKDQDLAKIKEFENLLNTLAKDPDNMKSCLAEYARKLTALRVNERSLARRYTILLEVESDLRKENNKLEMDISAMENAVKERMGYLSRFKEFASYKLAALQKALAESVPESDLILANKQYNDISAKYRDLLQRENSLLAKTSATDDLELQVKYLHEVEHELKRQLLAEKERAFTLEQSLGQLLRQPTNENKQLQTIMSDDNVLSMARQLATIEMKELNERQKAEHAVRRYDQLKIMVSELETRNAELEEKFSVISSQNLELQRVERELREELSTAIPEKMHRQQKSQIVTLEASEAKLKLEVSKLREVADVATSQAKTLAKKHKSQEKTLSTLRKELYDLQMETDEKAAIAKLYQHVMALQVSEATAVYKLEKAESKVSSLETRLTYMEQRVDDREQSLSQVRNDARTKARFSKKVIQDLRRQYSGALPLVKQEKFSQTLRILEESKLKVQRELRKAQEQSESAESQLAEVKLKNEAMLELVATLEDRAGAEKVMEWHKRISEIRLQDLKLRRQIEKLETIIENDQVAIDQREKTITLLEEQLVLQAKDFEERLLTWEQHEVELERTIMRLEKQQSDMVEAAQRFEEATGSVPDNSLPVANQLEHAIRKIKEHIKTIILTRAETSRMKSDLEIANGKVQSLETESMKKDKLINELRLRLPFDQRSVLTHDNLSLLHADSNESESNKKAERALHVAQATIDSLNLILEKKEETLAKYQNMLKSVRDELRAQDEAYKQELKVLHDRLNLELNSQAQKIKQAHLTFVNESKSEGQSLDQLKQLSKLKEVVGEQDNAMGVLTVKYTAAVEESKRVRKALEDKLNDVKLEMKSLEEQYRNECDGLRKEINEREKKIIELKHEVESLIDDLKAAKEANERAPSKTMRNLVEKLRNQLALKEKQQKTLSQALLRLRADMVTNAESTLKEQAHKMEEEMNVQKIVEAQTAESKEDLTRVQAKLKKIHQELQVKNESLEQLKEQCESLQRENRSKETALQKIALELKQRENVEDEVIELRARNKLLEKCKEENRKLKQQLNVLQSEAITVQDVNVVTAEQEIEHQEEEKTQIQKKENEDAVQHWHEIKQWQQRTEKLKIKLKEKNEELQKAKAEAQTLRNIVTRQEKSTKPLTSVVTSKTVRQESTPDASVVNQEIEHVKRELFQLQNENSELQVALARKEEEERMKIYRERSELGASGIAFEIPERDNDATRYPEKVSDLREERYQRELLEVRKENMELNFENERATRDLPRLRSRIQDLEEYVDVLKAELDACRKKERQRKTAPGSIPGQSVEDMERVIAAMRRVIERLHKENETLQKQSGKGAVQELRRENRSLKRELDNFKAKSLSKSDRNASMAKGTSKLIQENDTLKKELKEEKTKGERLKEQVNKLKQSVKAEGEQKEEQRDQSRESVAGVANDVQEKPAKIVAKYEEKIKALQTESDRKSQLVKEMKDYLKVAADKEAHLLQKVEKYEKILDEAERADLELGDSKDIIRMLRQAKLKISRLEAEKNELLHDVDELKRLTNANHGLGNLDADQTLVKLRHYDNVLASEQDLRAQLRALEQENQSVLKENHKLREELSAFDPTFFEELEDLKYNYKVSVERNVLYERQLRHLSKQFGVQINIPTDDDD